MINREGEIMLSKKRLICMVLSLVMLAGLINLFASTNPTSGTTMITPNTLTIQWEDGSEAPITINTFRFFDFNVAQLRTMVGALGGAVDNLSDDTFQVMPYGRSVNFNEINFRNEREIDFIINETPIRSHDGTLMRPEQPGWIFIPEFEYNWASVRDIINAMNFTLVDFVDNPADGITEIIVSSEPPIDANNQTVDQGTTGSAGDGPAVLPPGSQRGVQWASPVSPGGSSPTPTQIPTPSPTPTPEVEQGIPDATEVILSVSNNVVIITSGQALETVTGSALMTGPTTVYFYAEVDGFVETVVLLDENGNEIGEMKDDGQFATSGDDLDNDGIFTFKKDIPTTQEDILRFNAKFTLNDGSEMSNEVVVYVVAGLTIQELQDIDTVDTTISAVLNDPTFILADFTARHQTMNDTLMDLANNQELIIEESILFDVGAGMFTFTYNSNILGGVLIRDLGNAFDGGRTAAPVATDHPGIPFNSFSMPISQSNQEPEIGNAIILNTFEDTPFRMDRYYIYPSAPHLVSYSKMVDEWNDSGLLTTHETNVTLPDLRNLNNHELIWFAGHGSYFNFNSTGFLGDTFNTSSDPAWFLNETRTMATDHTYSAELKLQWAMKIFTNHGESYAILPSFIQETYSIGDFSNSFIVFNSCEIMGRDGNVSDSMADAFINNSAKAFVGYHNPVQSVYSRSFLHAFVDELISEETAQTAFNNASALRGGTNGSVTIAHPILRGNPDATLINFNVMNGSFELASTPIFWHAVGDVRIMRNWGELSPVDGARMAFLSTGIGAASSTTQDFFDGTQGSMLEQRMRLSDNVTTLSFSYNFVSEEPSFIPGFPTFVGSSFNDAFMVELIDMNGNKTELAYESVNTSNWITTPLTGFRLSIGNSQENGRPAYHIGWQTAEVDLTPFQGQIVTLRFTVFDRGDQAYDSVGLIDNIVIE